MYKPEPTAGKTDWFVNDRFGMFIHWGLYALPARHEWVANREETGEADYRKYFDHFDPDLFDPAGWARAARAAGMKYVVLTAKHHEGFCLWDSRFTDYKATRTPAGRDLLKEVMEAFRSEGLKTGLYYSLLDWHHPHFPIDGMHPLRNHPRVKEMNKKRDVRNYARYMRDQIEELLTGYGQIDVLWMDFSYPWDKTPGFRGKGHRDWESEALLKLVRRLQPEIMVNNRLDLTGAKADFHTPEQVQPTEWVKVDGKPVVWEGCQTFSGSWGYHRDETSWKSPAQLVQMLIQHVSCGGNLLMNVGPTARGILDSRALDALGVYRDWIRLHGRSIYGCTQSRFKAPSDVRFTQNGSRLYAHLFAWPFQRLHLPGLAGKVRYAQLLNDASEIKMEVVKDRRWVAPGPGTLTLNLPVTQPPVTVPVVELFLNS